MLGELLTTKNSTIQNGNGSTTEVEKLGDRGRLGAPMGAETARGAVEKYKAAHTPPPDAAN